MCIFPIVQYQRLFTELGLGSGSQPCTNCIDRGFKCVMPQRSRRKPRDKTPVHAPYSHTSTDSLEGVEASLQQNAPELNLSTINTANSHEMSDATSTFDPMYSPQPSESVDFSTLTIADCQKFFSSEVRCRHSHDKSAPQSPELTEANVLVQRENRARYQGRQALSSSTALQNDTVAEEIEDKDDAQDGASIFSNELVSAKHNQRFGPSEFN